MKHAMEQNKLFQNASLLMCIPNFGVRQIKIFKTQSERHAITLLFKVQTSQIILQITQIRVVFYGICFAELYLIFLKYPINMK